MTSAHVGIVSECKPDPLLWRFALPTAPDSRQLSVAVQIRLRQRVPGPIFVLADVEDRRHAAVLRFRIRAVDHLFHFWILPRAYVSKSSTSFHCGTK